jgi:PAS domain S-box-containing protein
VLAASTYQDKVLPAWQKYTAGNKLADGVSRRIYESWLRCDQAGVNPYDNGLHSRLDNTAIQAMLEEKRELINIAKPFMGNLYRIVQGSGFVVVLTDERGYIMEMLGDEDTLNNPMTESFFKGASWREEVAGTNAIGTALVAREPIQVSGAEHYCLKHHALTCSAAPIFDGCGNIIGVLDMSGASYMSHQHTLGMVVAAVEAIVAGLDIRRKNRELALANSRLMNIFNTMSDGVLMLDADGIITQLNPMAKEILGRTEQEILGISLDRLMGGKTALTRRMLTSGESFEDVELMVDTRNSPIHCLASGEPLTDEQGMVIGGVIILRPIKQVQNLVNRFSGYHATLQFSDIIGKSDEIIEARRVASLAATTSSNILLQGESGTGKEIFAQAIHNHSERRSGPFVAINCGVIPRELIGSELFGYVEGAFTGAKRGGKPGKFELASGGTIFLDEIGDMPLEQQVALLRVLQEKAVTRIGGDKLIPVNVRIICATNKNLLNEVGKGAFRQDLYYRLNVISITIPPLRNRLHDIPLLVQHFLDTLGQDRGCKYHVQPGVMECMQQYAWPGNVRELQNVVERVVSLSETETITLAHLPSEIYASPRQNNYPPLLTQSLITSLDRKQRQQSLGEVERNRIMLLLSKHGGNVSEAAREFGVSRNTFYRKMRLYAINN